jgi:hypothetical protein
MASKAFALYSAASRSSFTSLCFFNRFSTAAAVDDATRSGWWGRGAVVALALTVEAAAAGFLQLLLDLLVLSLVAELERSEKPI